MPASKSCIFSMASCGSTNASSFPATTTTVRPEPTTTASGARPVAPASSSRALTTFCNDHWNGWERVMLNKLSEQIRECLEHAEDCARKAAAQPDGSALKQDFLNLEKHWQSLAQSLQ